MVIFNPKYLEMTDLERIIRSRKSTYPNDFNGESITQEELEKILEVTAYTPNHKKTQPWRFHVFLGDAKAQLAQKLADLYKENTAAENYLEKKEVSFKEKVDQSSAAICIVHHISQSVPEWEEHAAIAMAVQNLWLKATELNIGGYWSTMGQIRHLDEFLDLEENENCIGIFFLGKTNAKLEIRDYDWKSNVKFRR